MEAILASSSLSSVVLGVAATLLALAVLVQVLQEVWKFLFSTQASVYTRVLEDFLGPWARMMTRPGVLPEFQARGPFQWRRLGPTGTLLPLAQGDLVEGLERTSSVWLRRGLRALRLEAGVQQERPAPPTAEWERFVRELTETEPGGPGDADRREILALLAAEPGTRHEGSQLNADRVLRVFRERFFPQVIDAERHFGRLKELFEFQYRRRNLLLTFLFGTAVALALGQPFQGIVARAQSLTPDQAIALADQAQRLYRASGDSLGSAGMSADSLQRVARQLVDLVRDQVDQPGARLNGLARFQDISPKGRPWYLLGCVVTGILLSFGAPFWNDLLGMVSNRNRAGAGGRSRPEESGGERDG